jgi:hypothetical protein
MTSYVYSNFKTGVETSVPRRRLSTIKTGPGPGPAHWDWSWLVSLALVVGSSAVVFRLF